MIIVNARELQHRLKSILDSVERGETIQVERRKKAVARIIPLRKVKPPKAWPDLEKRLSSIYGEKRVTSPSTAAIIYEDRERR